jgi:N-acetylglucosamine-6-phosphate deacetylase
LHGYRAPKPGEYRAFFDTGMIRIATCAAELPGAEAFYRAAYQHGYLVTCGHSNATWTEMRRGYDAGLRHVDHFWCAMSSIESLIKRLGTPMQGSMEQFVYAHEEMSTEVIADGHHLAPELLNFAFVQKGVERLCLVTDSNRAMDMPPGRYRIGPRTDGRIFQSNGQVGLIGGMLASSIVGMDVMVRNMKKMTSATLAETIRMASLTPAERAGVAKQVGSLEAGKCADVLVLSKSLEVKRVFIDGEEFRRQKRRG